MNEKKKNEKQQKFTFRFKKMKPKTFEKLREEYKVF